MGQRERVAVAWGPVATQGLGLTGKGPSGVGCSGTGLWSRHGAGLGFTGECWRDLCRGDTFVPDLQRKDKCLCFFK